MRAAVKVPSGCLVAAAAATATPDLSSLLLATSKRVTGTLGPTMIFLSPSLSFTVRTGPSFCPNDSCTRHHYSSTILVILVITAKGYPRHPFSSRHGPPGRRTRDSFAHLCFPPALPESA